MLLDIVQLLALAVVVAGIWVAALAAGAVGGALILTGLIVLGAALAVEHRTT
jgi:hypothetical protein